MLHKKIYIIIIFIFSMSNAIADLHLEPSYSWQNGTFNDGTDKGVFSSNVMGLKVGFIGSSVFIGLNMEVGDYKFNKDFSTYETSKYKGGGVGSYLGFYWGPLKIWTSYLNSSLEPLSNSKIRYFGQQFNYGIGYKIGGSFYLNYEIIANSYTQLEDDITGKTQSLQTHVRTQGQSFSLSIQWAIF